MSGGTGAGSFLERTRGARKIIVVDLGFLGDSVHLVPALWEIKRNYPEAELHTLSAVLGAETLKLAPCVDRAWAFPLTEKSPPWWKHWDILKALRNESFDVAINLSGSDRSIFITAATGARHRLGYEAGRRHFWNRWLIPDWVPRRSREVPIFEQRRQVLSASGFQLESPRFDLRVPGEDRRWALENVPENAIHLSINASTPLKEWPMRHWATLSNMLARKQPPNFVIATVSLKPREQQRLAELTSSSGGKMVKAFSGLSLGRLAAALERCSAHVGADSGVLHLAMALGIPTVSIFRQYEGINEWRPSGRAHGGVVSACPCGGTPLGQCLESQEPKCLAGISPEQIFAEINRVRARPEN